MKTALYRVCVVLASAWAALAIAMVPPAWVDSAPGGQTWHAVGGGDAVVVLARRQGEDPMRSTDGGQTWTRFTVLGVRPDRFIPSPTDGRVFYALAGGVATEFGSSTPAPSTLYRSSDAGVTWEVVASPWVLPGGVVLGHLVVGADPNLLYAARMGIYDCMLLCSYDGEALYLSTDGGGSWRSIDAGLGNALDGRMAFPAPSDPYVAYASTRAGLFRTMNQGATWTLIRAQTSDPTAGYIYQAPVVVDRRDASLVYVQPRGTELWVTEDGGNVWRVSSGLNVPGPDWSVMVDPTQTKRLYFIGGEGEIFESRDAARVWKRVTIGMGSWLRWQMWQPHDGGPSIALRGSTRVVMANTTSASPYLTDPILKRVEVQDESLALGSDLWWNPHEAGRGWSITQHASGQMFVVWYHYDDATGTAPTWHMMSGGSWTDSRTFTGPLYAVSGPAYFGSDAFDSTRVAPVPVGSATLRFADDNVATFTYAFDAGAAGVKDIERFQFGTPWNAKQTNYADLWWNPDESGWGLSVSHQFGTMFLSWYVYDAQGRATWLTVPSATFGQTLVGNAYVPRYQGQVFRNQGASPASSTATPVGTAAVTFSSRSEASFTYTVDGVSATRRLARLPF